MSAADAVFSSGSPAPSRVRTGALVRVALADGRTVYIRSGDVDAIDELNEGGCQLLNHGTMTTLDSLEPAADVVERINKAEARRGR